MSKITSGSSIYLRLASFPRFSVAAYHRMLSAGILDEDSRTELLEGYLVTKMGHNPLHATATVRTRRRIERLASVGWEVREEKPITLPDSEPQPDVAVARGDDSLYVVRHPAPADLALWQNMLHHHPEESLKAELSRITDLARLKRMVRRAVTAMSWREILDTP